MHWKGRWPLASLAFLTVAAPPGGGCLATLASEPDSPQISTPATSTWTVGIKKVLLIRVDFPDLTGDPYSVSAGENLIRGVHQFYQEMSYGKVGFSLVGEGSDVTPTFRMPQAAVFYGANEPATLRNDARRAASAAGYILEKYDLDVTWFNAVPGFTFLGLATEGAAGTWLRSTSSAGVAAHEFGHNFGLSHASAWNPTSLSPIGPGRAIEYGDKFDGMGTPNANGRHFNTRYKNLLHWLPGSDVITVTQSGLYRITAHDDMAAAGARALRIAKDSRTNYWVEFRQKLTQYPALLDGVSLRWAGNGHESTLLLDMTPGSAGGLDDSPLVVGRTFSDQSAGIHITPLRKLGTTPESVEVAVNLGSFSENKPPSLVLAGETNAASPEIELGFTAEAGDPDGDTLAYSWDFADQSFGPNSPSVRHRWAAVGDYVVRSVVSDLKGGQTSRAQVVRIGAPATFRLSGRLTKDGQPVEGMRVFVSSSRSADTDSDGRYFLVGLEPGAYRLSVQGENWYLSLLSTFTVGPSRADVDIEIGRFIRLDETDMTLVYAGSLWRYLDDGSDPGPAWSTRDFEDRNWKAGPAPLGYGGKGETTTVASSPSATQRAVTRYFRNRFMPIDAKAYSVLKLRLRRDDGGVVYLNGVEIFRSNMPEGPITATTLAASTVVGDDELTFFETSLDPSGLTAGPNVLAVEIHQATGSSPDMIFDLTLSGSLPEPLQIPMLACDWTTGGLMVSWPATPSNLDLQSASFLSPLTKWTDVTEPIVTSDGLKSIHIHPGERQRFFRLVSR